MASEVLPDVRNVARNVAVDRFRPRASAVALLRLLWITLAVSAHPVPENAEDDRLGVLTVEGENGLRIDYCKSCQGYLKTYAGEGSETVLLADWTSIHLDVVACDRGLKRLAASLYELNQNL
jgi:hypothetical protein